MPPLTLGRCAQQIVADYGKELRCCHERSRWYVWDGRRWLLDTRGAALERARRAVGGLLEEANLRAGSPKNGAAGATADNLGRLKAALRLAGGIEPLPVWPSEVDAHPWLFNCASGTLDLRTGVLGAHDRSRILTRLSPVAYSQGAQSPAWQRFLQRVLPDEEVRAFVQRAVGCSLTGDVSARCVFLVHGPGRSGKSVFLYTVCRLLGDYAVPVAPALLYGRAGRWAAGADLASLEGARMAVAASGPRVALAGPLVRGLCAGEPICARLPWGRALAFRPQLKLWLETNQLPAVGATDDATWDRIVPVPFGVRIPDDETVPRWQLAAEFEEEAEGILAWMVEGACLYARDGLGTAPGILEAARAYREDMDGLGPFLAECCTIDPCRSARAYSLYQAYERWTYRHDEPAMTQHEFGRRLTDRGFVVRRKHDGVTRVGLALLPDPADRAWKAILAGSIDE